MTDTDDAGLVKAFQVAVEAAASGGRRNWVMDDPRAALLGRLSAQAKEIEELRRERDFWKINCHAARKEFGLSEAELMLRQIEEAKALGGRLEDFDAAYAKGFAAGLEAAAEMVKKCKTVDQPLSAYYKGYESAFEEMEELFRSHAKALAPQP